MRKLFYLLIVLSVALVLAACGTEQAADISSDTSPTMSSARVPAQSSSPQIEDGTYVEGELLVKFKPGVKTSSSLKSHQAVGAQVKKRFTVVPNLEHVALPEGLPVQDALSLYMSDPNVEIAEPNYLRSATDTIPNDQLFGEQWALRNTGTFAAGTEPADIKALLAWDITQGSRNTVIAILDTGIDYDHVDLVENMWRNWGETSCTDGIDNDNNGYIDDCVGWDFTTCEEYDLSGACVTVKMEDNDARDGDGHGTHVSGTVGARTNNGIGIAGVMWHVQLMPVKMLNDQGLGSTADEINAINYVVLMKQTNPDADIKAINASFGGSTFSQLEMLAIKAADDAGILFVAAAGNNGETNDFPGTAEYPASYRCDLISSVYTCVSNIISVAATDQNDRKADFSNWGLETVHLGAPGVFIISTIPGSMYSAQESFSMGTSMAAPHVTGTVGLVWNYYYYFNHSQVRRMIVRYVNIVPELQAWVMTGGRLDAYAALSALLKPTDLTLNVDSWTEITLTWTDHATGEDYYMVERSTSGGPFEHITTLGPNTTTYTDSALTDGTRYSYRVRAMSSLPNPPTFATNDAYSFYSNEASAVTPLIPPTGLSATAISSSQINLSWTDHSMAEDGYRIERSSSDFVQIAQVPPGTTFFSDTGLAPETEYTYRVRAFNAAAGNSDYSNEASARTLTSGGTPPPPPSSGSSCSLGARQNTPTAIADLTVMLIPLLYILYLRRRR
jgi:subtilisin family serine protease